MKKIFLVFSFLLLIKISYADVYRLEILPFENLGADSSETENISQIVYKSFYNYLNYSGLFQLVEKEYSPDVNSDFEQADLDLSDFVIYGTFEKMESDHVFLDLYFYSDIYKEISYSNTVETVYSLEFLDSIDGLIKDLIGSYLSEPIEIAYIKFDNLDLTGGIYGLFINERQYSVVSNARYSALMNAFSGLDYEVDIQSMDTAYFLFNESVNLEPNEVYRIKYESQTEDTESVTDMVEELSISAQALSYIQQSHPDFYHADPEIMFGNLMEAKSYKQDNFLYFVMPEIAQNLGCDYRQVLYDRYKYHLGKQLFLNMIPGLGIGSYLDGDTKMGLIHNAITLSWGLIVLASMLPTTSLQSLSENPGDLLMAFGAGALIGASCDFVFNLVYTPIRVKKQVENMDLLFAMEYCDTNRITDEESNNSYSDLLLMMAARKYLETGFMEKLQEKSAELDMSDRIAIYQETRFKGASSYFLNIIPVFGLGSYVNMDISYGLIQNIIFLSGFAISGVGASITSSINWNIAMIASLIGAYAFNVVAVPFRTESINNKLKSALLLDEEQDSEGYDESVDETGNNIVRGLRLVLLDNAPLKIGYIQTLERKFWNGNYVGIIPMGNGDRYDFSDFQSVLPFPGTGALSFDKIVLVLEAEIGYYFYNDIFSELRAGVQANFLFEYFCDGYWGAELSLPGGSTEYIPGLSDKAYSAGLYGVLEWRHFGARLGVALEWLQGYGKDTVSPVLQLGVTYTLDHLKYK